MEQANKPGEDGHEKDKPHKKVQVSVYTTSGSFPGQGHIAADESDRVSEVLEKAKKALHLTDTSNWVATVDGRDIDPAKTFGQNGLTGTVVIQWGPREGGGG